MSKTPEELLFESRETAVALLEDIEHLKEMADQSETSPVDLRHASAILRRWIVDGNGSALKMVASPRIGKLSLSAINNNPVYKTCRGGGVVSFVSGGVNVHGVHIACGVVTNGVAVQFADYHPDKTIELSLDSFTKQKVIFTQGEWLTRQQVIKFVANIDRGVHDGVAHKDWEKILTNFRQEISVTMIDPHKDGVAAGIPEDVKEIPAISWQVGRPASELDPVDYDPKKINGVLLELLATINFFVKSPDVERLASSISVEIGQPGGS